RGTINVPLSDRLSTRVSAMSRDMEGYGERIVTGEKMGGKNQAAIKAAVRWIATDNFEINLAADYTHADEESPVSTTVSGSRQSVLGGAGTLFAGVLYNNLIGAANNGGLPGTISMPPLPADTLAYDERWVT